MGPFQVATLALALRERATASYDADFGTVKVAQYTIPTITSTICGGLAGQDTCLFHCCANFF
jgi:hypothetical protein